MKIKMFTILSFKSIENKHDAYRRKDCVEKFYESLREHAIKAINFEKKKIKLLKQTAEIIWKFKFIKKKN